MHRWLKRALLYLLNQLLYLLLLRRGWRSTVIVRSVTHSVCL